MIFKIRPIIGGLSAKERETVLFAAKELQKYLMAVSDNDFSVIPTEEYDKADGSVSLGINLSESIPSVADAELDDAVVIDIKRFTGVITGTNARSVLIGAYRYLKELGFAFIRPTANGEHYPETLELKTVSICEKASYRHRGVCIEGSVFQKNLTDIIDWLPKAAMNGYFMQFQLPRVFFDRWYLEETPFREKENLSDADIMAIVKLGEAEIEKRSLLYHGVGHGWTTQAFGIDGSSWATHDEPEPEYRDVLALVNGERKLWGGIPLNTNLCYSTDKARERVTDNILEYCKTHPEVTYLHFWLADGSNNNCECENCRKKRTSDYYVQMLNELDEKLTKEKLNTRIVFLIYIDLFWKPLYERLHNNDRFVLMFAPITRSYSESFDPASAAERSEYELNKLKFPKNVGENIAYLKDWQEDFDCDSFDFDYHLMWDHYLDFAQYKLAHVLYEDIKKLEDIGLNGFVSCQIQRTFFPSSLCMNILGETLWNKNVDFEVVAKKVLMTEFGASYGKVQKYLLTLSEFSAAKALRGERELVSEENVRDLTSAIRTIDEFRPVIEAEISASGKPSAWEKLKFHAEFYRALLEFFLDAAKGNGFGSLDCIRDMAQKNEMRFKDEFDSMYFMYNLEERLLKRFKDGRMRTF